jgi:outer membrane protein assembly factor BamB
MRDGNNSQIFEMRRNSLIYDQVKSILLCRLKTDGNRKLWARKVNDVNYISSVIEDEEKFYISFESGEKSGQFIAIYKENGKTGWYIPGKSFLQVLFGGALYLIFVDEQDRYYLIKVRRDNGKTEWHYRVDGDLCEYRFKGQRIRLYYSSNKFETISALTGKLEYSSDKSG